MVRRYFAPDFALLVLGFTLGAAFFSALPAHAALVWRPGEGWVDETTGSGLSASSSHDQLDMAKKLQADGKYEQALKAYRILVRKWPLSFFAPEAQFNIGICMEKEGQFWDAFQSYQKMVKKYPASNFFEQALDREFAIGNLYLAGEPQRLWKIPMGPSMDRTVEIFEAIIKAAPYGANAAQAQFKIGLARENQKKFSDAVDAYTKILDKYPGNSIAADAQYQIGYAWYSSANEAEYDQSAAEKAIEAFEDFVVRYPNSEKVPAAQAHIDTLKSKEMQGSFYIAKFYEKAKNYKAAYIYYNDVVRQNPDSKEAQISKKKIDYLRTLLGENAGTTPADAAAALSALNGGPTAATGTTSGPAAPDAAPNSPSATPGPSPDAAPDAAPASTSPPVPTNSADNGPAAPPLPAN